MQKDNIPFLDLTPMHRRLKTEIFTKIEELYDRNEFIYSTTAKAFEADFASFNQAKYTCAVDNGTSALEIALRAAGIGPGDEVITVANTFVATIEGIHFAGATPVFAEVDPKTWNIDPTAVEACLTHKAKAILAVNLYGQPADMIALRKIADKHSLILIGDSAQSVGSKIKVGNQWQSTSAFVDMETYSFYPGKNLGACGEGGAIVTNDQQYVDFIAKFRDHGSTEKYIHEIPGRNQRMDGFQAAVLQIKLKYIEQWNESRRQVAAWYNQLLADVEQIQLPYNPPEILPVHHLYPILVDNREDFMQYMHNNGVGVGIHYKLPVHLQKAFAHLGVAKGSLPVTESIVAKNVSLPMYPDLTKGQIEYVASVIHNYFNQK